MTNWLLRRSRLNNNEANMQATTRIIIVNGIFNYLEAANTDDHLQRWHPFIPYSVISKLLLCKGICLNVDLK